MGQSAGEPFFFTIIFNPKALLILRQHIHLQPAMFCRSERQDADRPIAADFRKKLRENQNAKKALMNRHCEVGAEIWWRFLNRTGRG
jgi:hypothetical protein